MPNLRRRRFLKASAAAIGVPFATGQDRLRAAPTFTCGSSRSRAAAPDGPFSVSFVGGAPLNLRPSSDAS